MSYHTIMCFRNRKASFIFLFMLVLFLIGCTTERKVSQKNKQDSYTELVRLLGADISTTTQNETTIVEYCPDNTCESFLMPSRNPTVKLNDFVFLYLYYVSDYRVLGDFRKKIAQDMVAKIIQRNSQRVEKQNLLQSAKNVIESLAELYLIKVKFVRYDERERNEVDINIKTRLKKLR